MTRCIWQNNANDHSAKSVVFFISICRQYTDILSWFDKSRIIGVHKKIYKLDTSQRKNHKFGIIT